MRRIITLLIMFSVLLAVSFAQSNQSNKALNISLKDLNGKAVKLSSYKGKVVLINFWATWCPPCREEIPELIKWQSQYKDAGLQILGVTYPPTNESSVRSFIRKNKINYPIFFGTKALKELFDKGETLPLTVIIDKEGNIKASIEGILYAEEFDEKIKPLLKSN